ncbi:hypothetical protein ACPEF3_00555 [Klebsiella sp. K822]|uniref:DUF7210 family protein n=1 Tax=Klebsiella TaxID=570 RepID=UPI00222F9D71|nr:hypothetical protein [Klebsiella quasipneumoniae]MDM9306099.1 hypothetical protein [Klebsiella quasipneumoniae subsp. similipneumoniae]
MKIIAVKPIYFGGVVVAEGELLETQEQHGRELVKKGYARLVDVDNPEQPETVPEKKAKK